jgi:hypothetical protein
VSSPSTATSAWSSSLRALRADFAVVAASCTAARRSRDVTAGFGKRPASATRTSSETPNALATATMVDSRGSGRPPVSRRATTPCGTPRAFASAAWVMPARLRARWIAVPKDADELATSVVLLAQTRLPCTKRK